MILHSKESDLVVVKSTINRIVIDARRNGISYSVRKVVATLPAVPKVVITANPIGPQLQAPADAPIKDPSILPPIFRVFTVRSLTL